jgi:hypothetical protein
MVLDLYLAGTMVIAVLSCHVVYSECPNACSSHGSCGSYDTCSCYRNWIGNDCSERICQFGLAHIDNPKGDLDYSGYVSGPGNTVVRNSGMYPYGTTEQYGQFEDSDGNLLHNTAHEYSECSNKGLCDRKFGVCKCFAGYEGSSCQRLSCPVNETTGLRCNGHGLCEDAKTIAKNDYDNQYDLWDRHSSQGCTCEPGFYGPMCESRTCKVGFDPIFYDTQGSRRHANWSYVISTTSPTTTIWGNYSIIFYDYTGMSWRTSAIDYNARCGDVVHALESLPNDIIKHRSIRCLQWHDYHNISSADESILATPNPYYGTKFTLDFPANPGYLRQPEFDLHLDGSRPTLESTEPNKPASIVAYPDGFQGENYEYFSEKCVGVDANLLLEEDLDSSGSVYQYLGGLTPLEARLLGKCLGDGDGEEDTYSAAGRVLGIDYTWDYGSKINPHLVRLVDQTTDPVTDMCAGRENSVRDANSTMAASCVYTEEGGTDDTLRRPPGFIVPLYYDRVDSRFKIFTRPGVDYSEVTNFAVFTTNGWSQLTSDHAGVRTFPSLPYGQTIYTLNATADYSASDYTGNLDCETNPSNTNGALQCVQKEDIVFFVDPHLNSYSIRSNPKYLNLYRVKRVYRQHRRHDASIRTRNRIMLDQGLNSAWYSENDQARMYVFTPPPAPQYGYRIVSECANRGSCETSTGICECFAGFTGDACSFENNIIY